MKARALIVAVAFGLTMGAAAGVRASDEAGEHAAARESGHVAGQEPAEHAGAEHGAGEHGEPKLDGKKFAAQLVNFALLLAVLLWFGGKAVSKALTARHQQLKADLVAASELRSAAEAQLKKQEQRLSSLEQEIAGIRAGIVKDAEAEKVRLIELAEERARRIQEETKFLVEQQVKEAEAELRREAAQAAVDMAEQIVRRSLDAGDRQRMVDSFVTDVAKPAPRGQV